MSKVTIITATLCQRTTLECACASVDAQTFTDWHHYVLGDGADPSLPARLSGQRRSCIALRRMGSTESALDFPAGTPNPVYRWALTHLLMNQDGYVAFLDDDDAWLPTYLQSMVSALEQNPDASVALCPMTDFRYGRTSIDGHPELGRCGQSAFLARVPMAQAVEYPHALPHRNCQEDFHFIKRLSEGGRWIRVPESLVLYDIARRDRVG